MGIFLDTLGMSDIAIAVCDRCKMKRPHAVMQSDPNFPGLQVCDQGCKDQFDPYRLPARKTERINIRFPRPDVSVAVTNNQNLIVNTQTQAVISTEQSTAIPPGAGQPDGLNTEP